MIPTRRLDYAPQSPPYRRVYRRAFQFVAFAGVIAACYFWGPGTWKWTHLLYWQHECLVYSQPPYHLVFDADKTYCESATALMQFEKLGGMTRYWQNATIFLHEMRSPDGSAWLVSLGCWPTPWRGGFTVMAEARRPRGFFDHPLLQYAFNQYDVGIPPNTRGLRVFAGQIDPVNPTLVKFEYQCDGQKHIMESWLKDSGEIVVAPRP